MSDHTLEQRCLDFERINYYFGKMMLVRDFQDQQRYYNEKRWMVNRFGLGWGVLAGLKVTPHPQGGRRLLVEPGFALDQYGHEIWVCKAQTLDLETANGSSSELSCVYIYLRYRECLSEAVQVPAEECGELTSGCRHNRTRETFELYASADPPEGIEPFDHPVNGLSECELECHQFLANPVRLVNQGCPPRNYCLPLPLAKVCYDPGAPQGELEIDNITCRKVAGSNELLYELIDCLTRELWDLHAARRDRRPFVPLLVQSISGVRYQDGRIKSRKLTGLQPVRLASDGRHIWATSKTSLSRQSPPAGHVVRLPRDASGEEIIDLKDSAWGVAFDGKNIWITHHETGAASQNPAALSRINVCDLDDRETKAVPGLPPEPQEIAFVERDFRQSPGNAPLHRKYLCVLHSWDIGSDILSLSLIDPASWQLLDSLQLNQAGQHYDDAETRRKVAMTDDGNHLWVVYPFKGVGDSRLPNVCLVRIGIDEDPASGAPKLNPQHYYPLESHMPEGIGFDGSHVWITHDDGATRVDVNSGSRLIQRHTTSTESQTAQTFDGRFVWTIKIGKYESMLSRIDTLTLNVDDGEEIHALILGDSNQPDVQEVSNLEVSGMCFDGTFIWLAASGDQNNEKVGIIHRFLG